ncbi:MAG: hypothetical protein JO290_04380 [Sphingomonadaceae bacterium]|nr:hypothetical protein [Sphingomonadaceae bacterium]
MPTEQSGVSVSRNITGLASLAGVSLPKGQVSQFPLALETLKSRDVADAIVSDQTLMHRLFPHEWDAAHRRWREPDDALAPFKAAAKALLAVPPHPWSAPGAVAVQKLLERDLAIEEDQKRSIATISLTNADPMLARDVLAAVYRDADAHLRQRMDARTAAYIDYISHKLQQVTLAEHREALAAALAEQERTLMIARSGQPFAADPLGVVAVADKPVSPNPLLALAAGTGAGITLGGALVLLRDWRRRRAERTAQA